MTRSHNAPGGGRITTPLHVDEDGIEHGDLLSYDAPTRTWVLRPIDSLPGVGEAPRMEDMTGLPEALAELEDANAATAGELADHDTECTQSLAEQAAQLETLGGTVTAHGSTLATHATALGQQAGELAHLGSTLTATGAELDTLAEQVADRGEQTDQQGADLEALASTVAAHDTTLGGHTTALADQAAGLETLGQSVFAQGATLATHTDKLGEHTTALAAQAATLATQGGAIAGLTTTVSGLSSSVTSLSGTVSGLSSTVAGQASAIGTMNATLGALAAQITALQNAAVHTVVTNLPDIALLATVEKTITWAPAMPNTNYRVLTGLEVPAAHLGKINVALKKDSITATGCVLLLSTVLAITAGAGRLHVAAVPA